MTTADELEAMRRLVDERFRALIEAERAVASAAGTQHEQRACVALAKEEVRMENCGVWLVQLRHALRESGKEAGHD